MQSSQSMPLSPLHSCSTSSLPLVVVDGKDVEGKEEHIHCFMLSFDTPLPTINLSEVLQYFKDCHISLISSEIFSNSKYLLTTKSTLSSNQIIPAFLSKFPTLSLEFYDENYTTTTCKGGAWFPRTLEDLDLFSKKTLEFGASLSADHPGFSDSSYRKRREEIIQSSLSYRSNNPLPTIQYTSEEIATWSTVYCSLKNLYPTHACKEFLRTFPLLELACDYSPYSIPSLQKVSSFLYHQTGFRLRPVQGLLSSRDFLNSLALRVFHCTQYIRHPSSPLYTPEPDCCHELLGHVPLFADADFASFSHEIGLASLGASDSTIQRLSTIYWYTVEFGLCEELDETGGTSIKAYGAGLLSSFGELQHSLLKSTPKSPFDPWQQSKLTFPICTYQPRYFVAKSFSDAKEKVRQWIRDEKDTQTETETETETRTETEFYLDYQRGKISQRRLQHGKRDSSSL